MRLDAIDDDGVGGLGEPSGALSCRARRQSGGQLYASIVGGTHQKVWTWEELTELTAATAQSSDRAGKLRTRLRRPFTWEARHAKTKPARLHSGAVSGHSSTSTVHLLVAVIFNSALAYLVHSGACPLAPSKDHSNIGMLERTKTTVTVTVMVPPFP